MPNPSFERVVVPYASIFEDDNFLPTLLMNRGVTVMPTAKRDLLELVAWTNEMDLPEFTLIAAPGAINGHIILPSGVAFGPDSSRLMLQSGTGDVAVWKGGTLEGWKEAVRMLWNDGNNTMRFALIMAATGLLSSYVGIPGFTVALTGKSSSGKSTGLRIAAGFNGHPSGGSGSSYLALRMTLNGCEGRLVRLSGLTVSLDEAKQFQDDLQELVFMIAEGKGKSRADQRGNARAVAQFYVCAMLSSESSITDLVQRKGGKVATGMDVRCFDLDVSGEAAVKETVFHQITKAMNGNYGHGCEAFAAELVTIEPAELLTEIRTRAKEIAKLSSSSPTPYEMRAAEKFAVMDLAGAILSDLDIVPKTGPSPSEVIDWAWRSSAGDPARRFGDPIAKALDELRFTLISKRGNEFANLDLGSSGYRDSLAWYSTKDGIIYLPTQFITKWSGETQTLRSMLQGLKEEGVLIKASGNNVAHKAIPRVGDVPHYRIKFKEFLGVSGAEEA